MLPLGGPADSAVELLACQAFQRHSASVLRSLMHASPQALPLLHHFPRLKQVLAPAGRLPSHPSCSFLLVAIHAHRAW